MSRSILFSLFAIALVLVSIQEAQGLAGILNRVRNNIIWGKSRKTLGSRHANSLLPVQVAMAKQASVEQSPFSMPHVSPPTFDADAYRQEMTDLVYQRSMQRMYSS
jgi:hypothetical protein